ncbi:acyltransferase family protein [Pendulispora rubella]|uniref:Acyltransferase family protein n=1 Tax=Pendulispora rubella TaxID=2741070 RepID=A0ABZ2LJS9_9BACT
MDVPANNEQASSALVRIGSAARAAWPWARRVREAAGETLDSWMSSLLGEDFAERLQRVPVSLGSSGVDPFGLDPGWTKYALASAAFLHRRYFRTDVYGANQVPTGRVLLIANHSGQIPIDGAIIGATMFMDVEPPRFVRAMVEKWSQSIPFVSTLFPRVGQVVGVPENARRLLEQGEALLVFPEGARGISKTFDRRYQLTDFGLGFMRLAIETKTPIIPIAVIGGEEQYISVGNLDTVAKLLRMPSFPVIPQFLLPGGQLPLPTKYRVYFGEPMHFTGDHDDDDAVIEEKVWLVKATIQSMLNRGIKARRSVFW